MSGSLRRSLPGTSPGRTVRRAGSPTGAARAAIRAARAIPAGARAMALAAALAALLMSGCSSPGAGAASDNPAPAAGSSSAAAATSPQGSAADGAAGAGRGDDGSEGMPDVPLPDVGAPTPRSLAYPAPADALYVSPTGSDSSSGTLRHPLRTVEAAVASARDGQTIVLRAGSYHESIEIPAGTRITLQPYANETVWLDGSRGVTGFVPDGGRYSAAWDVQFDHSPTYIRGAPDGQRNGWRFVSDSHPLAAHPDQVWLDGRALRQVGSREEVDADSFHVDYAAARLTIGADPAGRSVRASALAKALSIRSDGTVIRGLGIRRYAPSVPHMGAVTAERPGIQLEALTIRDNATTGLSLGAADLHARNLTVSGNGMLGITATYADRLQLDRLLVTGNNTERFNYSPVAGGIKIARSHNIRVSAGIIKANEGTGLWVDESVRGAVVTGNVLRANAAHGFSAELSADVDLVDNIIAGNGGAGAKINNTSRVRIWNNTFSENARELNIVQDERRGANPDTPGHDPRYGPDPLLPWINGPVAVHNNIFSATGGQCLLCVEDYSREFSAEELGVTVQGNVYRDAGTADRPAVLWAGPAGRSQGFASAADFAAATGQESRPDAGEGAGTEEQGTEPTPAGAETWLLGSAEPLLAEGTLSPAAAVRERAQGTALPLPEDLAGLSGRDAGIRHLGAFVRSASGPEAEAR